MSCPFFTLPSFTIFVGLGLERPFLVYVSAEGVSRYYTVLDHNSR